jgi:hypothetical protein
MGKRDTVPDAGRTEAFALLQGIHGFRGRKAIDGRRDVGEILKEPLLARYMADDPDRSGLQKV